MSVNNRKQHPFLISGKGALKKTRGWCWLCAEAFQGVMAIWNICAACFFFLAKRQPIPQEQMAGTGKSIPV